MKIEAGCDAIIINSVAGNNGISLTVIRYIGIIEPELGFNMWLVDKTIKGLTTNSNYVDEVQLMRIDGFSEQDQISDGKELSNVE